MSDQVTYQLGLDLGTAYSAAAVCQPGRAAPPEIIPLAPDSMFMPSVAFLNPDGTLLVGAPARDRTPPDPSRLVRQFKRRIGDGIPLQVGGIAITADEIAARFIAGLLDVVAARVGGPPSRVALTHPAGWGPHRLMSLRAALAGRGIDGVLLLPEPQAAALAYATSERLSVGAAIAVYDLGAGTFDATVVRMIGPDRLVLLGHPEEIELGYLDFDEAVFEHVRSALGPAWDALDPADPAVLAAVARLRRDCMAAKEALSANTDVSIPVALPGIDTLVRLARSEFEEMIHPAVIETADALERALGSAGLAASELAAVLMVGGSARIPLVTQEISARLGRPVSTPADPKGIVAIGAALAASAQETEQPSGRIWPALPTAPVAVSPLAGQLPPAVPPPPPPTVPPRPVGGNSGAKRRRAAIIAAAAAVAAVVAIGGVVLASRFGPTGAGADPTTSVTSTVSSTEEPAPVSTTTPEPPPPGVAPVRPKRTNPPPPRPTTTTTTAPTTTTSTTTVTTKKTTTPVVTTSPAANEATQPAAAGSSSTGETTLPSPAQAGS